MKTYPCGCTSSDDAPSYCPTHGRPQPTLEQVAEFNRLVKENQDRPNAIHIDRSGNPTLPVPVKVPSDPLGDIVRVKELRRDIDTQIQRVKSLKPSRERALVITKLQEGVMWLGMDLKRISEENPGTLANPYPDSKDPSNTRINPTADNLKL